jgi:hypothetical protein
MIQHHEDNEKPSLITSDNPVQIPATEEIGIKSKHLKLQDHLFKNYPSPTLFLLGAMIFLTSGAILLRTDLVILGLIPFIIMGFVILSEKRLQTGMRTYPLRGVAYPPTQAVYTGKSFLLPIELENRLPFSLGTIRIEIRTCSGLSSVNKMVTKVSPSSKTVLNMELIPTRAGPAFFYGLSVILTSPFGFRPRRYYLLLPILVNVNPPWPSTSRSQRKWKMSLHDKRAVPSFDGDFAYLREYIPGDPSKAIVKSVSIKKHKHIVRLSYPQKKEKWSILMDLSPSFFRGIPGKAPFDQIALVLPFLIKKLKKDEHETSMILFGDKIHEFMPKVRESTIVPKLADYRYRCSPDGLNLPGELLKRITDHLAWNFGIKLRFPESLQGETKIEVVRELQNIIATIPHPKGIKEKPYDTKDLKENILHLAWITGLELPATNETPLAIATALDLAISKNVQNILIFSEFEPIEEIKKILPRLNYARKKGIKVHIMLLDDRSELFISFGTQLLEREAFYRWGSLLKEIRSTRCRISFWNPSFPQTLSTIFKNN